MASLSGTLCVVSCYVLMTQTQTVIFSNFLSHCWWCLWSEWLCDSLAKQVPDIPITVTSRERYSVSNQRQCDCLFRLAVTKKKTKLCITGHVSGESIGDRWIPSHRTSNAVSILTGRELRSGVKCIVVTIVTGSLWLVRRYRWGQVNLKTISTIPSH